MSLCKERFPPIPKEILQTMIGEKIHLAWANKACVWKIVSVDGDTLNLITPKTRNVFKGKVSDARYLRASQPIVRIS